MKRSMKEKTWLFYCRNHRWIDNLVVGTLAVAATIVILGF